MSATKTLDTLAQLVWLAEQGATFTLPRGRSKGKGTLPTDWTNTPHTIAEALAHAQGGGNVGLLVGKHSGGIVAIDIDRDWPGVVPELGPYAQTVKVARDNAPDRGKLLFRVDFPVKSRAWNPDGDEGSPWAELLSDGRHAVIPPSEFEGGRYVLADQHYGIAALTEDELAFVWYKATEGRKGLPEPERNTSIDLSKYTASSDLEASRALVLDAWATFDVFDHFGKANDVDIEHDGQTRLRGNGGLLIKENGEGWYAFSGNAGGGDAISAWGFCKRRPLPLNGKAFWDTLREMADAKGLTLPTERTNGALHMDGGAAEAAPEYWRSRMYTLSEFLKRPRKQWAVDTIFGERDFVLLYGESGHGKTHVALDLAFSCATGRTFADAFTVARPMTVVYATGEGIGGLADRLLAISHHYGTEDAPFYVFTDIPQLFQHAQVSGADAFLHGWQSMAADGLVPAQIDILILDTLHNATAGADENSAKDAGITQATMRRLRDALGCTIVLVHHAGKNGATERGSSAIRATADTVLRASKAGILYTLACEKLKDGETWEAKAFSLVPDSVFPGTSVRIQWQGNATANAGSDTTRERRLIAYLDENADTRCTADEVAQAVGDESPTAVHNTLKRLRDAGSVQAGKEKRTIKDGRQRDVWLYWRDSSFTGSS